MTAKTTRMMPVDHHGDLGVRMRQVLPQADSRLQLCVRPWYSAGVRIHNVKTGFSTNSSSSHSILFFKSAPLVLADTSVDVEDNRYGWDDFTLASPGAKLTYLGTQIMHNLRAVIGAACAARLATQIVGMPIDPDGYVDHQSVLQLPTAVHGRGLDLEFLAEFMATLRRDDVAVIGGNDNHDDDYAGHPLAAAGRSGLRALERDVAGLGPQARRDPSGYWTLYNRATGARVRMSFDPTAPAPTKAAVPELVDLKITDYCPFDCSMCYQGSTREGRHAEGYWAVDGIIQMLGELRVFEVAIGGGEPTLHPTFGAIVRAASYAGVTPNFTTKNVPYVSSTIGAEVIAYCGGFAVSVGKAAEVELLARSVTGPARAKLVVQHIVGMDAFQTGSVIRACAAARIPLTLLGYKYTGRGAAHAKSLNVRNPDAWIDDVKRAAADDALDVKVAIDTVLADKFYDRLIAEGVPEWCLTRKDGQFSAYIDAVTSRVFPSSYVDHPGIEFKDAASFTAAYQSFGDVAVPA